MFAGPNGSGKSTVIDNLFKTKKPEWIGIYLNADEIEKEITQTRELRVQNISIALHPKEILGRLMKSPFLGCGLTLSEVEGVAVAGFRLVFTKETGYSYLAAGISEVIRSILLENKISFSFETVMSHESKIEFLRQARSLGYKTYLYFVSTVHSDINVSRVLNRVSNGGHPVPEDKIRTRYIKSLALLKLAILASDRAFIFDNSGNTPVLVAETRGVNLWFKVKEAPIWIIKILSTSPTAV
jgi:predicted ABC-type ATPase